MNTQRPIMILAFLGLMSWIFPVSSSMGAEGLETDHHRWIGAMYSAVLMAQASEGDHDGAKYAPYLRQLRIVGSAMERGDDRAAYASMNRFMDMLETREYGIAPEIADWLFDYCQMVTPPKFHDVSRHIRNAMEPRPWEPVG